jgi:sigma-B regulation protein RsbU (phosphoserine phosphatase)
VALTFGGPDPGKLAANNGNFTVHHALSPLPQVCGMTVTDPASGATFSTGLPGPARHVLVVDDSRAQRHILSMQLRRWGYRVTDCAAAVEALAICRGEPVDMVISDWMMPGMTGLEFCKEFRALGREAYGYFVLLTSKSEKTEIADGLEAGADDFRAKPVAGNELRARLRAGERMLAMQAELLEKNRVIANTLSELQKLYDSLDRDLIEARKLQQTLIRDRLRDYGWARAALLLRNSGRVGGDLVGSFPIDDDRVAVYSIDVSGHGVASAMMTARLAGFLTGSSPDQNLAFGRGLVGQKIALPPDAVADRFNRLMLEEIQAEQYFTMVFAVADRTRGRLSFVQAGHPHPMLLRASGQLLRLGQGGLPVGLIPGATYDLHEVGFGPGDRLVLVSDGFTECPLPGHAEFGEDRLCDSLQRSAALSGPDLLEALVWDLAQQAGTDSFPDDISGLVLDLTS